MVSLSTINLKHRYGVGTRGGGGVGGVTRGNGWRRDLEVVVGVGSRGSDGSRNSEGVVGVGFRGSGESRDPEGVVGVGT